MLDGQELKDAVTTAVDAASTPAVENTSEPVSSPEVKLEAVEPVATPEQPKLETVDAAKLKEQIENLNIALKQEREDKRGSSETIKSLQEKLAENASTLEKMKEVFNPTPQPPVETEAPKYLTADELESFLQRKEEERKALSAKAEIAEKVNNEISELTKTWDGKDGKPLYEDDKVIEWQDKNNKFHLTPSEAFFEMSRSEIIDWEVKQRLSQKPEVQNVEKPGGVVAEREMPSPGKPKTDNEIRQAISDAMDAAMADNNT